MDCGFLLAFYLTSDYTLLSPAPHNSLCPPRIPSKASFKPYKLVTMCSLPDRTHLSRVTNPAQVAKPVNHGSATSDRVQSTVLHGDGVCVTLLQFRGNCPISHGVASCTAHENSTGWNILRFSTWRLIPICTMTYLPCHVRVHSLPHYGELTCVSTMLNVFVREPGASCLYTGTRGCLTCTTSLHGNTE